METSQDLTLYFWSPAVHWRKAEDRLIIEAFYYEGLAVEVFPEFYYLTQGGIDLDALVSAFPQVEGRQLRLFVKDLIKKRILTSTLLTPQEVFFPQSRIFQREYRDELLYDAQALKAFKAQQLNRTYTFSSGETLRLAKSPAFPAMMEDRRSYRKFNESVPVPFEVFSCLMSVFRQIRMGDEPRYYYASAGGLYPIDVFVAVKRDRVQDVAPGLYYYNPRDNLLQLVDEETFTDDCHLFANKSIFRSSAFSVYFIYNADCSMPKYRSDAYFYACLDVGLMVGAMTQAAEFNNLGLCAIGEMSFKKIEKAFGLSRNQVHLHCVEVGLKPGPGDLPPESVASRSADGL